ncbi:MAG: hypothetical protein ACLUYZ_07475 [Lachnospiraceae bacterium]
MVGGVMELDLHGMNTYQAQIAIDAALRRCGGGVYRLRLIHGYRGRHRHPGYAVDGVQQAQSSETPCQYQ